jgi:predicted nuclease of predicted toxin-antitoxin system
MPDIKFIADVNVEKPIVEYLSKQGYDIKWIPDINCEMTGDELLELANKEKRILITNDKDFGELIFLQKRLTTGIILFRVKIQKSQEKMKLMKKLLMGYREKFFNHFIVITKDRIRLIPIGDKI